MLKSKQRSPTHYGCTKGRVAVVNVTAPTYPPNRAARADVKGAQRPTPKGLTSALAAPQSAVGRGQRPISIECPASRPMLSPWVRCSSAWRCCRRWRVCSRL